MVAFCGFPSLPPQSSKTKLCNLPVASSSSAPAFFTVPNTQKSRVIPSKSRACFDGCSIFPFTTATSPSTDDLILPTSSTSPPTPSQTPLPQPKVSMLNTHPRVLSDTKPLPRVVVFDLDYTLWPFWVDTHPTPPFKPNELATACLDKYGETFAPYPEVGGILADLQNENIVVTAASRTCAPELARELLKMLVVDVGRKRKKMIEFFDHLEIYPGSKKKHFERIKKATGVPYEDMLFFDDEERNREVESMGVTMYLVKNGVSCTEIDRGVEKWRKRWGKL